MALTILVPGSAQLVAGNRKLARVGIVATMVIWVLAIIALALALINRKWLIDLATLPILVGALAIILFVYALIFATLAIDTLRLMRVGRMYSRDRWVTAVAMVLVAGLGTTALASAGNIASAQAGLISSIFKQSGGTEASNGRYNILLLGADSGRNRLGIRPDSISVLSIDAETGDTVNIGIPRNLQHVSFSKGSPLLKVYPNGWNCGLDCLINAIYKDVADHHEDLYPQARANGSTPGVDATREAVEYVTGLEIQSYVMVDMSAFESLVDALGGVDINVKQRLPIGGQNDDLSDVLGWIEAGPQHMDGNTALWYARSRHTTSDYDRMQRQREVQNAILQQVEPANVLTRFREIATAGEKLVKTDIPSGMLSTYVDLALKARAKGITPLELVPPKVNVVWPNFTEIHAMVKKATKPKEVK
jgi:LCP family protein required for cell wall assembly